MCERQEKKCCCEQKGKAPDPKDCSPEQIKECHGDAADHPCEKGTRGPTK
jgi:hypothetical protein